MLYNLDESEYISILPTSGILYLSKELDYETINSISFTVKVNIYLMETD